MNNKSNKYTKLILEISIGIVIMIIICFGLIFINLHTNSDKLNSNDTSVGFSNYKKDENPTEIVEETKELETRKIITNSLVITSLINNSWDRVKANMSGFEMDDDGNCTFKEGYKLYCNNKVVNYIIFDTSYKDELVGGTKAGMSFKDIKNKIGEPSFENDEMIGYKNEQVYVIFYSSEVVVYPNIKINNKDFEKILMQYVNKTYQGNRTNFLVEIREKFLDIMIEADENGNIIIQSTTRKFKAILDNQGNINITLYNGYNMGDLMNSYLTNENIEEPIENIMQVNDDIVQLFENERVNKE